MASYELRRFDTYPPINILLSDSSSSPGIDLTNATSVKVELKGITAPIITGTCVIKQVNVSATTSATTSLTSVSPTTGYFNGATISGTNITAGTTIVSGAGTGTLIISQTATGSGVVTLQVNAGLVQLPLTALNSGLGFTVADTYTGECEILWSAGGTQTVPNASGSAFTILVDPDEENV